MLRHEGRDDTGRLRHRKVKVGGGHRIHRPEHLCKFVRPSRVPEQPVDRYVQFRLGLLASVADNLDKLLGKRLPAGFQHLPHPIQDLPTVERAARGPPLLRLAGGDHRVSNVFA